jgi:photosystem II stability/assembly factor-like uncharacterized protein
MGDLRFQIGVFLLLTFVPAPSAAQTMKMLAPGTGWVLRFNTFYWTTLYWTSDGGNHWSDITPVPAGVLHQAVSVESVFFLDTQEGRAVISYPEGIIPSTLETLNIEGRRYEIAYTVNSGQTWSIEPFTCPNWGRWIQEGAFAGLGGLFFLDSQHGWLGVGIAGNLRAGKLLATVDGGRTWNWVNGPGTAGALLFTTTQDGWLAGGPGGQRLYATHDGCKTWEEVSLSVPPGVVVAPYRSDVWRPPLFVDSQRGYLAVRYVGPSGPHPKLVFYSTEDGGRSWRPTKVLIESHQGGGLPPVAIIDSAILVLTGSEREHFALARIPLEGETLATVLAPRADARGLAFADTSSGWVLTTDNHLLATEDGGATWKDVTPWYLYEPSPPAKRPASKKPLSEVKPEASESFPTEAR